MKFPGHHQYSLWPIENSATADSGLGVGCRLRSALRGSRFAMQAKRVWIPDSVYTYSDWACCLLPPDFGLFRRYSSFLVNLLPISFGHSLALTYLQVGHLLFLPLKCRPARLQCDTRLQLVVRLQLNAQLQSGAPFQQSRQLKDQAAFHF